MVTQQDARLAEIERLDAGLGLDGGDDVQKLQSNSDAYMTLVDMETGMPRPVLRLDYKRVLAKLGPDGKPLFWMEGMGGPQPPAPLAKPFNCFLDPEFDELAGALEIDRSYIDKIGLKGRTCNLRAPDKHNATFTSVWDRDEHGRKKHPREWRTLQEALARDTYEREREEAREMRQAMLAMAGGTAVAAVTAAAPATTVSAPITVIPEPEAETAAAEFSSDFVCDVCGESKKNANGLRLHKMKKGDEAHTTARLVV